MIAGAIGAVSIAIAGYTVRHTPESADASLSFTREGESGAVVESMRPLMGTQFAIKVWAPPGREPAAAEAIRAALDGVAELERRISSWLPDSDTAKVGRAAGQSAVGVGAELRELLAVSARWARRTGGAFDVTAGPLFELWDAAREQELLPSEHEIQQSLARVGYDRIELRDETVRLPVAGMKLGFGSVGKGFAADRVADQLRAAGFANFIIDAGGDLVLSGSRGDTPWNIGIRHPRSVQLLATTRLTGCAIATSGDYEQYLVVDGVRYGHIIDPRTGWPAREVASVVVVAPRGADADALATGLFVLGPDKGLALVEKISSVEALFVMDDGDVRSSAGLLLQGKTLGWVE